MAEKEEILEFLRNSRSSIKVYLRKIEEIEKDLGEISLNEELEKNQLLEKTKQLIDDIFRETNTTKKVFCTKYEKLVKQKPNLIEPSSSAEYEDAVSSICVNNDIEQEDVRDETTTSLIDNETSCELKNAKKKCLDHENANTLETVKNSIKSTHSRDLNKDHSDDDLNKDDDSENDDFENLNVRRKTYTSHGADKSKPADIEMKDKKQKNSANNELNQRNSNKLKTKHKISIKEVESGSIQKELDGDENINSDANSDNIEITGESEMEKDKSSEKQKLQNTNGAENKDSESDDSESASKSSTTDPAQEKNNSDRLNTNEDKEESEKLVTNDDVEMATPEIEENIDEAKENDEVEPSNNELNQLKDKEDKSEDHNQSDENRSENTELATVSEEISTDDLSKEVSTENISEKVSTEATSEAVSTETISEEVVMESDSIKQENVEDQNKDDIEVMPKIRLVSLDKLMAKPKKSVTFDTSVIILSSDDESSPQKSAEPIEQNGTLKSALKNSPAKKIEKDITSTKSNKNDSDENSTSLSRKSSRIKGKGDEKQKERIRLKSIFTRTKANEWKGKNAFDADSDEEKSSKNKKSVVDISDSSDDDSKGSKTNRISKKQKKKSKNSENDIYIPLPIIKCDRLQEVCLKNDNVFSVERILSRVSKKGKERNAKKRIHKVYSDNSSDSDRQTTKRKKEDSSEQSGYTNKDTEKSEDLEKNDKKDSVNNNSDSSEDEAKRIEKIDTVELGSSDSEDDFTRKTKSTTEKKKKKVISDSEDDYKVNEAPSDDSSNSSDKESGDENEKKKGSSRRRIKRTKDSSESEEEMTTRKQIRRLIDRDSLSETTKKAEAEEKERKARIAEKQKKYNALMGEAKDASVEKVVLEIDEKTEKELLCVDPKIATKLKPHQASGIRFMWDACFESLERAKSTAGSGCILAHCMGLGKTLQIVALTHTLIQNSKLTGVDKVLVVCPVNTVLNWKSEFKKWLPRKTKFEIFELVSCKQMYEKQYRVTEWHEEGGVLIMGYTMFRNISNPNNKKIQKKYRDAFERGLVDPGPDMVVCDEGHLLKNEKTHLSIAMNRIKTSRRIVLTGTPLQNNLKEYWCMVQFIKPNLLGTYKEYLNRFVNPITNGQYTDSTQHDTVLMRKRSHVLHKLLDGVVQRRDYSVLAPYLPPKHEYVLFVRLSDVQVKLCQHYMENYAQRKNGSSKVSFIFADFQQLQRICTHPRVLMDKSSERRDKLLDDEDSEGSLKDFIDDGEGSHKSSSSSSSSSSSDSDSSGSDNSTSKKKKRKQQKTRVTRAQVAHKRENGDDSDPEVIELEQKEWWQDFCDGDELDNINNSGKLSLLFHLLKECEEIGDKILIFSQSLYTLNCIEYFLDKIDEATTNGETEKFGGYSGTWHIGLDYFRLDGSSSCDNRAAWCDMFNSPDNTRARLFLISTKAGGLGINLVAANRVIIFDVSWNPSHDIQSIYRVYRFGQTKPCYIYRFVTYGAMEMKIYERQVTKQAISKRVIDEQQIDRHYNQNDLQELYKSELVPIEERPIPLVPKDVLLGEMLQKYDKIIYKYHEHQTLLENKEEECLNEEERKAAWEEFENEKVLRKNPYSGGLGIAGMNMGSAGINAPIIAVALANIVRRDNPTWSEVQINGIIPALVQQLKVQLSENDTSMYLRVQQEIQRMQAEAREIEFQRQMRQIYAQNQYMQMVRNPMNYAAIRQMYDTMYTRPSGNPIASGSRNNPGVANDVIELND